jgi:hypothetical protein
MMEGESGAAPTGWRIGSGTSRPDLPVAVYGAYGVHVGRNMTQALREPGVDARYVRGGLSACYAAGGARRPRLPGD